jgi:hypothetical protein
MRAPDKWESARFLAFFLTSSFSRSRTLSTPAHLRVTLAVEQNRLAEVLFLIRWLCTTSRHSFPLGDFIESTRIAYNAIRSRVEVSLSDHAL